ncbi:MAG: glycosyltransferase family 4 protein [Bacilli bacterium]|nr:glycosyltransferase family 4 protein [Bacilli bacterium]
MTIIELISDISSIGGGQTLVESLAIQSKRSGSAKIVIISLYAERSSSIIENLKKNHIEIYFLNKKRGLDLRCCKELKKLISKIKPNVIHAHLSTYITIYFTKIPKNIRVFYTFHSIANKENSGSPYRFDNLVIKRLIVSKKMSPIAISETVKESIQTFYKIKKIPVVNNGVDIDLFHPKSNFVNRKYDFIIIGSFTEIKNQLGIIKILIPVIEKNKDLKIVLLGDGPLLDSCKDFVRLRKLDNFSFEGNVNNVHDYLRDSSFLLMKSLFEGNPMVINEAIASGTFVISNNVGGIPDIVNENNGMILKNEDDTFKREIGRLYSSKDSLLKMLENKVSDNRKQVSIEKTLSEYLFIFT